MSAAGLMKHLDQYLALRAALGYRDHALRNLLLDFLRHVTAHNGQGPVRAQTALEWACATAGRNSASRLAYRLSAARGFLTHLCASVPGTEVPAMGLLKRSPRRIPYLFSGEQVAKLLQSALQAGPEGSLRPHTYETMLGLMASTGIRVSEAIHLHTDDVDLDAEPARLRIRESKFKKSRFVPLHPTTAERLKRYARLRAQKGYKDRSKAFFVSERQDYLCYETLRSWFTRTAREQGMCPTDGRRSPTLHGLRHYFAVERLTQWCQQGMSTRELAPTLSVYLGHVRPADSYWYLSCTPALLKTAADLFQNYATQGAER